MVTFLIIVALIILTFIIYKAVLKNSAPLTDFVIKDPETKETRIEISFEKSDKDFGAFLVFDIETTGLPRVRGAKPEDLDNWPRVLQISWLLFDADFKEINSENHYLMQDQKIPIAATRINNIDDKLIKEKGEEQKIVFERFLNDLKRTSYVVAHNIDFDVPIIESEFVRFEMKKPFRNIKKLCTMKTGTSYCKIPKPYGRGYKYPKLEELFKHCYFGKYQKIELESTHNAEVDATITAKCFIKLKEDGCFKALEE